ncbi:MAG TPA: hypothetical protein VLT10_00090 [Verrucomicrobiae bacterium]|nr:hypothetical protein [Verrucomicrobiae bacterium]
MRVTSGADPTGIPMTIAEQGDTGIFTNSGMIFTNGTGTFPIGSSITVGIYDSNPPTFNTNSTAIDQIISGPESVISGVQIFSTTDNVNGIFLNLTETGPNTGIFTNKFMLTSGPSVNGSAISVHPGDVVSIQKFDDLSVENILVTPADPAFGAIPVFQHGEFDNINVTYNGITSTTTTTSGPCGGGGGGSGGLIQPGLVADILGGVGGSPYIVSPPSFGGRYYNYSDGLSITQGDNKTVYDIGDYNNEIPKQIMISGHRVSMTFKTFESYNPDGLIHMGLYIMPKDVDMLTTNSLASIEWDRGQPAQIDDKNKLLSNATVSVTSDGKFQYTTFSFTPTKSYDKMSFLARAWNGYLYSTDVRVHDAVDSPKVLKALPAGVVLYDDFGKLQDALENDQYYKPSIMNHIHGTDSVFGSTPSGKVYWLYDTIQHTVTLVISDNDENILTSQKATLEPYKVEQKGDYKFMYFTVQQLNRYDEKQEQTAMEAEAYKAMFYAQLNGLMPKKNW